MQLKIMSLPGEGVYSRLFFRKPSLIVTPVIARLAVTPNMLTVCSIIMGTAGAIFLMVPGMKSYFTGLFLVFSWYFLDVVDGDLARFKQMQSLKGIYIDTLGHYIVNPLIFSSFSIYLAVMLNDCIYIGLGFTTFIIHQFSRLASDVCHSVKYVQIDHKANPRQVLGKLSLPQQSGGVVKKIMSVLGVPAAYILDAISITLIFGALRVLMAYQLTSYSVVIYIFLVLSVLAGTSLVVLSELNKLENRSITNDCEK